MASGHALRRTKKKDKDNLSKKDENRHHVNFWCRRNNVNAHHSKHFQTTQPSILSLKTNNIGQIVLNMSENLFWYWFVCLCWTSFCPEQCELKLITVAEFRNSKQLPRFSKLKFKIYNYVVVHWNTCKHPIYPYITWMPLMAHDGYVGHGIYRSLAVFQIFFGWK